MSSPCGDVDEKDLVVDQALGEGGGEVVAAGFDQDEIQRIEAGLEVFDGLQVGGDVVADSGVRAGAGLDGGDSIRWQDGPTEQGVGVFAGVDVVGHHGHGQAVTQPHGTKRRR